MSLSFREQLVVAICDRFTPEETPGWASRVAAACCDEWGHDDEVFTGVMGREMGTFRKCRRCGAQS